MEDFMSFGINIIDNKSKSLGLYPCLTIALNNIYEAIKQSKNNNPQGLDKLNIRHLNHIGPLGLAFLMTMLKTAL